ncbi:hypothetical protein FRACA_2200008 [Frankia canadensis]|uniref:Uncharacterized protein n=1 Tax=Frankia canadensis TaxID=1836972 RepID=A0A2I2KR24_9ACTN|nr:hypothetical protein FRACA_2200008 [Frankia canadensis]SOU55404.1 hypothetical protein FRACA_2200008 [Frankia canadensis]
MMIGNINAMPVDGSDLTRVVSHIVPDDRAPLIWELHDADSFRQWRMSNR